MAASPSALVDLQTTAGDLAHRLSFLRHFQLAATELLTCEKLSSREINRHCRKIVTLIEIAQATLSSSGMKLYKFTSCRAELFPLKLVYFRLLRMLDRMRPCIHDKTLHGRIKRLLLPLFTNLWTPASDDLAEFSQASVIVSGPAVARTLPPSTSSTQPPRAQTPSNRTEQHGPVDYRTMPPPDVLLCGRNRYRGCSSTPRSLTDVPHRTRSPSPPLSPEEEEVSDDELDSDSDDEPSAPVTYRPRSKFGIYCINKPSYSRDRTDRSSHHPRRPY